MNTKKTDVFVRIAGPKIQKRMVAGEDSSGIGAMSAKKRFKHSAHEAA